MTQANKGDGWTLDISKARSGGPGTESNRARAARGGHGPDVLSVYLDGQRIAGAPMGLSGPFFDPADIEQARAIGVDHASGPDKTAIAIMLYRRPDGALIARGSDGVDRVAGPGEIRTPEDADRLFGVGFGLGRWMRENAGAAVFKVDDLTPAPQPDPAPGQVWLPPPGAVPAHWRAADGTVTIAATPASDRYVTIDGAPAGNEWRAFVPNIAAEGWTCIGIATPHGRVMVGDGFRLLSNGNVYEVSKICSGSAFWSGGVPTPFEVADMFAGAWERARYAPARAGERYRSRQSGVTIACVKPGTQLAAGEHAVIEGAWADPAQWERLDAGTAPSLRDACRDGARELREVADNLRRIGVEAPPTLDDIHAAFCAASLGPVETLAIPSRGEVTVYLPAPRDGTFERASDLDRRFRSLLPASTCFTVRWRESVDVMALRGVAHRLIRGVSAQSAADDVEERVRAVADYAGRLRVDHPRCRSVLVGTVERGSTLTLQAPARDLRALADAVGRALESAAPVAVTFNGAAITVARDEMLFTPTHVTGFAPTPADQPLIPFGALAGDTRALAALRRCLLDAMASDDGRATLAQWGAKGPRVEVRREYRFEPAAAPAPGPSPTRYDGANGGAGQWRWEVGE